MFGAEQRNSGNPDLLFVLFPAAQQKPTSG